MEYDPKDNEVIHLLKKLKDSNGTYPPEMLSLRRQGYLKQVAEVSAGAGLAVALRNIAKGGRGAAGASSTAGTVVEALFVIALIAEAGAVTYFYRDKVAEYFQSITRSPKIEEVASPPVLTSPVAEMQTTPSPVITVTVTGTETLTLTPATPSGTPPTVLAAGTSLPDGETGVDAGSASTGIPGSTSSTSSTGSNTGGTSAPTSVASDPNGNNGNHYGQTPIPERTKDPGNTSSSTQASTSNTDNNKKKP
jgi:hypothetical protein